MAYTRVQAGDDVTPEQINDVYDSMEKLEAITAEVVETLPAGSSATAQVVTDGSGNKKLELKIPQGATGATGQDGTNGKSVEWQGEWNTNVNYVNTAVKADLVRKDGNVYICKQNNQGAPPPNAVYWALFVQKGEDGLGAGNIKGTNVTALEVGKTYAIQATTIPSEDGTLEGILVEVASVEDLDRKLEKNFDGFYSEKTELDDDDLFVIQDSESGATPKVNKKVKVSTLKTIKVNNAGSADSATNAGSAANVTTNINGKAISSIFESNGTTVKNATSASNSITQTQSDNSTKIATTAYVRTAISNFYGSTTLGFTPALPVVANIIKRQGNLVILEFAADTGTTTQLERHTYTFTIPQYTSNGLALRPTNSVPLYYATRTSAVVGDLPPTTYGTVYKQHIGTNGVFTHTIDSAHYAWGISFFCAYERT
jgi:hypothetical protein